jgi:hypothetical protein
MRCFALNTLVVTVAFALSISLAYAQFAPVVGLPGTTAIKGDSSCFVEWATGCVVQRGPMNIADTALGYPTDGVDSDALGEADDYTVSLGDGGTATLTFNYPIYNGDGFDFAVFENGFMTNDSNLAFLELGFVEVSSDGVHFFRFPSISHVEDSVQTGAFASTDGGQLYDLAGKYIADYGTPFDLQELADTPGLDINNVTYVRVIDVVGSIDSQYATHDSKGNIVNDPWPTPFASCGFDLDAVGIIHAKTPSVVIDISEGKTILYPNPVKQGSMFFIESDERISKVEVYDLSGRVVKLLEGDNMYSNNSIGVNTSQFSAGIYFIQATTSTAHFNSKLVVE